MDPEPHPSVVLVSVTAALHTAYEALAASVAQDVRAVCPHTSLNIQHVGVTAVPGMLTKGDLDVVVHVDPESFGEVAALRPVRDGWTVGGGVPY